MWLATSLVDIHQPALLACLLVCLMRLPNFSEFDFNSSPASDSHTWKGVSVLSRAASFSQSALLREIILLPEAAFKKLDWAQVIKVALWRNSDPYLPVYKFLLTLQKQLKGEETGALSFDSLNTLHSSLKNACIYP